MGSCRALREADKMSSRHFEAQIQKLPWQHRKGTRSRAEARQAATLSSVSQQVLWSSAFLRLGRLPVGLPPFSVFYGVIPFQMFIPTNLLGLG